MHALLILLRASDVPRFPCTDTIVARVSKSFHNSEEEQRLPRQHNGDGGADTQDEGAASLSSVVIAV